MTCDRQNDRYALSAVRLLLLLVLTRPLTAAAQDEPEYRMEVGAGVGTVAYLGDYNGSPLKGMKPWGVLTAKYRMNPRMAVALNIGYGRLKGSSDNVKTWYPQTEHYEFSKSLIDAGLRFEYNFWAFGTGREYRGAKRLVPFIALGLGMSHHSDPEGGMALNVPIGVGIKYKAAERLNVALEWRMHFVPSDRLDGQQDPYGIRSSGLFKNTDGFSVLQLAVTYDVWAKCKTCHSDRF